MKIHDNTTATMSSSATTDQAQPGHTKETTHFDNTRGSLIQLEHVPCPTTPRLTSPPPTAAPKSTFKHLFTFTPRRHIPLLTLSFATAALVAAGRTAYAILLGRIFEDVSRFGAGMLSPADFLALISQWAVWMCVLGLGMWAFSTVDVAAWVVGGELRARTVREVVFASLLGRGMAWLDGRGEGVGALVAGVQT